MDVNALMQRQERRELKISSSLKRCNLKTNFENVDDIRQELLKTNLTEHFHDSKVMGALFCIFDMILLTPEAQSGGFREANEYMSEIFTELRQIGAESVDGYAFMAKFGEIRNAFIIKAPRRPTNDGLFHEYFVGIACTNNLRMKVPNFAYILGGFKCTPPQLGRDKIVDDWCDSRFPESHVNYVIYEKIDGKALVDECSTVGFQDFLSWFIQIAYSVQIGAESCGFTHYDLHYENVLMRRWTKNVFMIPYDTPNGTVYVRTNLISTIIDFGRSRVKVRGESFGVYGFEKYGVFVDRARPSYDLYKILGFCIHEMWSTQNSVTMNKCLALWSLMDGKDKTSQDILSGKEEYFETKQDFDVWNFLDNVREEFPDDWKMIVFENPGNTAVLRCTDFCPVSREQVASTLKANFSVDVSEYENMLENDRRFQQLETSLDNNVSKFIRHLSSQKYEIEVELAELAETDVMGMSQSVTTNEFRGFVDYFIQPSMDLSSRISSYNQNVEVLGRYYRKKGIPDNLSDFDLGANYNRWRRKYSDVNTKLSRMYIPQSNAGARDSILSLMHY